MKTRKFALAGLACVASLTVAIAGCGSGSPDTPAASVVSSAPAQLSPAEKLADAARKANAGTVGVTMRAPGMTTDARLDEAGRKGTMKMELTQVNGEPLRINLIRIDDELFVKLTDSPGQPNKWLRTDVENIRKSGPLDFMPEGDVSGAGNLMSCIVTAKRDGGHDFLGTLDLTRSRNVAQEAVRQFGDRVNSIPFTAWTENQGQLGRLEIDLTGITPDLGKIKLTYHSFGQPVDAQRPDPATITEAPSPQLEALIRA